MFRFSVAIADMISFVVFRFGFWFPLSVFRMAELIGFMGWTSSY